MEVGDEQCQQQVGHHQGQADAEENVYEREQMARKLSERARRSGGQEDQQQGFNLAKKRRALASCPVEFSYSREAFHVQCRAAGRS